MSAHCKQDEPDTRNVLDAMVQGVVGKPLSRPDGIAKVTGTAPYAAEYPIGECLEGVLVTAPFAKGEVTRIATASVADMPGVITVIDDARLTARAAQGTAGEAPAQPAREVGYFGQPVALVVAETFEQARDAAKHLAIEFTADELSQTAFDPEAVDAETQEGGTRQGDLAHAMKTAAHSVDLTYTTEGHASAAMEPHAAIAQWKDGQLTLHASLQMLNYNIAELADALGLEEDAGPAGFAVCRWRFRLETRDQRGMRRRRTGCDGVGPSGARRDEPPAGLPMHHAPFRDTPAAAARRRRRGAAGGVRPRSSRVQSPGRKLRRAGASVEPVPLRGESRLLQLEVARIHRMTAGSVRAPGEAVGMPVLEAAMDELAERVGIDPVELRLRNIPDRHPVEGLPYSSRKLAECLRRGAEAFGWESGPRKPRMRREGEWWIGTGMASAARVHNVGEARARVTLHPDGTATVATDMTDIGTGTYSILGQIAGEMLGLQPDDILVELGDTRFPRGPGSGGSWGASSSGSAVFVACEALREQIADRAGVAAGDLRLKDGVAEFADEAKPLVELLDGETLSEEGHYEPGRVSDDYVASGYGAFFAQVRVNRHTGETRVERMTGAYGFGRVLNAKTARSQCLGGLVWSIGMALTEALLFDPVDGHLANCDLAEYHVPVHRDVPDLEVIMVEERDPAGSPLQAKGIGELGFCGGAGAIANAIYNACGARLRSFPMTPDRVIAAMPQ